MSPEPIVLHTYVDPETGDRTVTAERFPSVTSIDFFFLGMADKDMLRVEGHTVTITAANGHAVYRLALNETDGLSPAIPAYLESSRLTELP